MNQYIIYFNQQWVGDHSEEWSASRGPLAKAVVDEWAAGSFLDSPERWRSGAPT